MHGYVLVCGKFYIIFFIILFLLFRATIACESSSGFIYKLIKEDNYEKEYNVNNNVGFINMC